MSEFEFADRIAKVRMRFVARFSDKLQETDTALPHLAGDGADAVTAVEATYRRFHDMCGIGSTIGLVAIGEAAKALDAILVAPFRARRGLSADELAKFEEGFAALRAAGRTELEATPVQTESAT